ncbi:neuromedin-B receptor-like [Amphiura filiformis]|uniref:neuromedin-B receptor-like n=1 Tax=Amphiura filiformis TaxID=82378 RepID=UPI003B21F1E2
MEANYTIVESESTDYVLDTRKRIAMAIDIVFFLVGFFGNGSVIYLTIRYPGLRSIPNLMIANLAVGDMLVVIFVIFVNVLHYIFASVRLIFNHYCKLVLFVQLISQGVSVLTLTALSVDRFTTVAYPLHKQMYARKLSVWNVFAIWTTSVVVLWPILVYVEDSTCWFSDDTSYTVYILCIVFLLFILPSVVMVVCYVLTAKELLRKKPSLKVNSRGGRKQQKKRSRLALIVLIMIVIFILSSSPFYIWLIVFRFDPSNVFVQNAFMNQVKSTMLKFHSIVNPVILYLMSSTYRRHLIYQIEVCLFPCIKAQHRIVSEPSLRTSFSRIADLARQNAIKRDYSVINKNQGRGKEYFKLDGRTPSIKEEEQESKM